MMKQKQICQLFGVSETYISFLLNDKREISWPMAEKLADCFPGKSISQWKRATAKDLKQAFSQLTGQQRRKR